jgi:hypothetical protein
MSTDTRDGKQGKGDGKWFERGYVCAAAEIIRTHGEDVVAKDVLRAILPVNWRNIDGHDREALKEVRADLRREAKRSRG